MYNPEYQLIGLNGTPFMVALGSIRCDHEGNQMEYVESVLVGGHEFVRMLSDDTLNELFVAYKQHIST